MNEVKDILKRGVATELKALFSFTKDDNIERIVLKFNLWCRYFFIRYYSSEDAPYHAEMDRRRVSVYLGLTKVFVNVAHRDSAKTTRAKLFRAFVIANDTSHFRKYLRVMSKDLSNAKQSVTDVYNILVSDRITALYPEIFAKTIAKREETMSAFTTSTGIKMKSDSVGTDKRGEVQEENRPDFDWYDDFETRISLMSALLTQKIWINMEEARTGLSKDGGSEYTCNYISERGNVHRLIQKGVGVMITPIEIKGEPTWKRFTKEDLVVMRKETEDYVGEYLCEPSASKDILFDRATIDKQEELMPIKEIGGFKIFKPYDPSHRYGGGADVAGGVGLDSSTSVFIDFDTMPAQVVGTYNNNEIKPIPFGDELGSQGERFGELLIAPENNLYDSCIGQLRQVYPESQIYKTEAKNSKVKDGKSTTYGWNTNSLTKPKMFLSLSKAIADGLLELNDPALIAEARSYTRNDLMDTEVDVRMETNHFDLLVACAIAWQMKDVAEVNKNVDEEKRIMGNRVQRNRRDQGI